VPHNAPVKSGASLNPFGGMWSQVGKARMTAIADSANLYRGFVNAGVGKSDGGAEGIRTPDPHNAIVVLYQLSYDPIQTRAI
jgi:hypothetical protein